MQTSMKYRRFAQECDHLAENGKMEPHQQILKEMAEAWRNLAEEELELEVEKEC